MFEVNAGGGRREEELVCVTLVLLVSVCCAAPVLEDIVGDMAWLGVIEE